ncbi:alginate export family protein [Chryseobacterium gwangjuense]|uniref:alginate export family protein n=1 Tax=Chryseobacterium gwangjuense TaxID=1069980 RepID=UPI001E4E2C46|nr:alginate export family protein [Chryseobacterium gwangjuense]MCE3076240.1 alginate export family protein [Chryseobacterium gwangjuense]
MRKHIIITLLISLFAIEKTSAQNKISLVRYNDDFRSLKNDTIKKKLDNLKYIKLDNNYFISFGGELREQFQYYDNINFGDVPPTYSDTDVTQLWHRLMVHTDIELGKNFRVFMQLNNTSRFFNDNPAVPEIEENQLSLHQAFAELKLTNWNFRLGFQEIHFGNHRVITVREGPNTRQSFDGLTVKRKFPNGSLDLFAVSKVISKKYVFDDESMHDGLFGIYGTQYLFNKKIGLDYYVINFQSRDRMYNYQSGFENRNTCGIRLFSNLKTANFELEGAYQTGKFNNLLIEAYNILADVNITVFPSKKGIIGFAANLASGDKNKTDNKLNTYNLLYAKPAYGLAAPIGATNMLSIYPYIKINPVQKLNILAEAFFLARNSNQDGTYSPGMIQNRPKPNSLFNSEKKTLGQYYVLETNYQQDSNLSFALDASYFKVGSYPKTTGVGDDILYLSFKTTFKW